MKKSPTKFKFTEPFNWFFGTVLCCLGICFCTKADFGLSMIAAPPFILHVFFRETFPWFTQGTSEYFFEAVVLTVVCLVIRRFKPKYLLSFATSVMAGLIIDFWFLVLGGNGVCHSLPGRVGSFLIGAPLISLGVAFLFRTEWPIQVPELAVAEIAKRFGQDQNKTKLVYDMIMLTLSVALSLLLTGTWTGVGIGTVIVTFTNAPVIAFFGKLIDRAEKRGKYEKS